MGDKKTLAQRLSTAQESVKIINTDSKNDHSNFYYVSSQAMILHCNQALRDNGLVLEPSTSALLQVGNITQMQKCFILTCEESGEVREYSMAWVISPRKGMPLEKEIASAHTSCLNYFLRDLLMVARFEEDLNTTTKEDKKPAPKASRSTKRTEVLRRFMDWCKRNEKDPKEAVKDILGEYVPSKDMTESDIDDINDYVG